MSILLQIQNDPLQEGKEGFALLRGEVPEYQLLHGLEGAPKQLQLPPSLLRQGNEPPPGVPSADGPDHHALLLQPV